MMNISWGWRIVLAYGGFVAFMLFLVTLCMRQNVELVADNYYEQELKYEQQIQKLKNASQLPQDLLMKYAPADANIALQFPKTNEVLQGTITLFRPSDKALDITLPIQPDTLGLQLINARELKKGLWRVKVEWAIGKTPYYTEKTLFIE